MKIFLITCIIAMVSAGIYGTIDLAKDIKQGTLIQYEKEDVPEVKSVTVTKRNAEQIVRIVNTDTKKEKNTVSVMHKTPELKTEYFSRSSPIIYDAKLFESAETDSINKVASDKDSAVIAVAETPVIIKNEEKIIEVKEEIKFSPKLFSRGRPRSFKKEIAITETDSLKKE